MASSVMHRVKVEKKNVKTRSDSTGYLTEQLCLTTLCVGDVEYTLDHFLANLVREESTTVA